jgi:hypothetical protein
MNKLLRTLAPALGAASLTMLACNAPARASSSGVDARLKVLHDGETMEVLDGICEIVTGKHIDVRAGSPIPKGEALQLKFGKVKA